MTEVIVDPARGRLLKADRATPGATQGCGATGSCPGGNSAPVWTDLVASGIVTSSTATVRATGSAAITADEAPGTPTGLVASVVNGTVALSWNAPADQGASLVTGYVISATAAGHGTFYLATRSAATSYNWPLSSPVTGLAPLDSSFPVSEPVTFAVEAVNAEAYGQFSTTANITP